MRQRDAPLHSTDSNQGHDIVNERTPGLESTSVRSIRDNNCSYLVLVNLLQATAFGHEAAVRRAEDHLRAENVS